MNDYELAPRPPSDPDCIPGTYIPLSRVRRHVVQENGVEYLDLKREGRKTMTETIDDNLRASAGEAMVADIKPTWWVRAMCACSHRLYRAGAIRASWLIADFCIWLQMKMR